MTALIKPETLRPLTATIQPLNPSMWRQQPFDPGFQLFDPWTLKPNDSNKSTREPFIVIMANPRPEKPFELMTALFNPGTLRPLTAIVQPLNPSMWEQQPFDSRIPHMMTANIRPMNLQPDDSNYSTREPFDVMTETLCLKNPSDGCQQQSPQEFMWVFIVTLTAFCCV